MNQGQLDDYGDGSQDDGNLQSAAGDFQLVVAVHFVVAEMLLLMRLLGELVHAVGSGLGTHTGGVGLGVGDALLYLGIIGCGQALQELRLRGQVRFAGRLWPDIGPRCRWLQCGW